jgi:protein-L-isoaspartate(D-aspartate) O-methyltransferase
MMARLPSAQRQEWLGSLAARLGALRDQGVAEDDARTLALLAELREVARGCRLDLVASVEKQLGPFDGRQLGALLEVPRERFVRPDDTAQSTDDTPLPLDDEGLATISAPHAYLLTFRLLELSAGDSLLELGAGSGYGAALASHIVGPEGRIVTVEIDEHLARWAEASLRPYANVRVVHGDALAVAAQLSGCRKIAVTFAVRAIPEEWLALLPEGGRLVAPVGSKDRNQRLVRVIRHHGALVRSEHGAVRYVKNRSPR